MASQAFRDLVSLAARMGASRQADDGLVAKVLAMTGRAPGPRLIAAATLFHCWLLAGRPDKVAWRYRARVRYAADVLATWLSIPEGERPAPRTGSTPLQAPPRPPPN